jgi:hypothetical protein
VEGRAGGGGRGGEGCGGLAALGSWGSKSRSQLIPFHPRGQCGSLGTDGDWRGLDVVVQGRRK